jgi:UPF0755 protein
MLVLLGTMAVIAIFAQMFTGSGNPDPAGVMVDGQAGRSPALSREEARLLYSQLEARAGELNRPASDNPSLMPFSIQAGDDALTVAANLEALDLISDAGLFVQLLRYNGLDTRLQVGDYRLRRNMTMRQVGAALYRGRSARLTVTVLPGWRMEELADYLTAAEIMDGNLFLRQARQGTVVHHPLLADRPAGQSYEGYLFPGSYTLSDRAAPADLIKLMLDNLAAQLPANAAALAQQQGLTFYQLLTLASIVERETGLDQERPLIASVFLNRLKPGSGAPQLQADPTVQYALGYQRWSDQWWKTPLDPADYTSVDSPYNTYLYPGLPPGPIASPGIDSIMAVLQPANTNYLFFVCRLPGCEDGQHVFSTTYEEHLQNAQVYWGQ